MKSSIYTNQSFFVLNTYLIASMVILSMAYLDSVFFNFITSPLGNNFYSENLSFLLLGALSFFIPLGLLIYLSPEGAPSEVPEGGYLYTKLLKKKAFIHLYGTLLLISSIAQVILNAS